MVEIPITAEIVKDHKLLFILGTIVIIVLLAYLIKRTRKP